MSLKAVVLKVLCVHTSLSKKNSRLKPCLALKKSKKKKFSNLTYLKRDLKDIIRKEPEFCFSFLFVVERDERRRERRAHVSCHCAKMGRYWLMIYPTLQFQAFANVVESCLNLKQKNKKRTNPNIFNSFWDFFLGMTGYVSGWQMLLR